MEKCEEAYKRAIKCINIADHMLTSTYPLVNDPKLLLVVMENIFLSLTNAMAALLYYERYNKNIPPFLDNFDSKFTSFKLNIVPKYSIDKEYIMFIQNVKEVVNEHKKSPVEFSRKDMFVICSEDYKLSKITLKEMAGLIKKAKTFINLVNGIILGGSKGE